MKKNRYMKHCKCINNLFADLLAQKKFIRHSTFSFCIKRTTGPTKLGAFRVSSDDNCVVTEAC